MFVYKETRATEWCREIWNYTYRLSSSPASVACAWINETQTDHLVHNWNPCSYLLLWSTNIIVSDNKFSLKPNFVYAVIFLSVSRFDKQDMCVYEIFYRLFWSVCCRYYFDHWLTFDPQACSKWKSVGSVMKRSNFNTRFTTFILEVWFYSRPYPR
jgi:hypothetical protein